MDSWTSSRAALNKLLYSPKSHSSHLYNENTNTDIPFKMLLSIHINIYIYIRSIYIFIYISTSISIDIYICISKSIPYAFTTDVSALFSANF